MNAFRRTLSVCLLSGFVLSGAWTAHAELVEDFSTGLGLWTAEGDVQDIAGIACLADGIDFYAALFRPVALDVGSYVIEFDFLASLSDEVPNLTFPDVFFASLYFVDDPDGFDLATPTFDDVLPMFDLDAMGAYGVNGVIGGSSLGGDWRHFSMTFDNNYLYAVPVFELLDQNFIEGDSAVCLDNISITGQHAPIPEPASVVVLGIGLLGLLCRGRCRHGKSCN